MVSGAGLALRGEALQSIALMGVELDRYDRIVGLRSKVVAGEASLAPGEAVIGNELASDLGVRVGDRFTLQTSTASESVRVTALVDLGVKDLNRRTVIVPLRARAKPAALPGGATHLDLALRDVWGARRAGFAAGPAVRGQGGELAGENAQLVSALGRNPSARGIIRAVVMVVVVLGIASVLVVSVVQKAEKSASRGPWGHGGRCCGCFWCRGHGGAAGSVVGLALAVALVWAFTSFVRGSDGFRCFPSRWRRARRCRRWPWWLPCGVLAAVAPARRAAAMDRRRPSAYDACRPVCRARADRAGGLAQELQPRLAQRPRCCTA